MSAPEISVHEAAERIAAGAVLVDVRQPEEWNAGHIAGATLIPLGELAGRAGEIPSDGPVVVVCRSGNRSGMATEALRAAGYDAYNLEGGMIAWTATGLPTVED
jgi:rhodanese-related sulfurtransferase